MEKIEARLVDCNAKPVGPRDKALQVQAGMRREYLSQVKRLENNRDSLRETYKHLRDAGLGTWRKVKQSAERALADFIDAFDKDNDHFKF